MNYDFELTILGSPISQGRPKARNAGKFVQIYDDPNRSRQNLASNASSKTRPLINY